MNIDVIVTLSLHYDITTLQNRNRQHNTAQRSTTEHNTTPVEAINHWYRSCSLTSGMSLLLLLLTTEYRVLMCKNVRIVESEPVRIRVVVNRVVSRASYSLDASYVLRGSDWILERAGGAGRRCWPGAGLKNEPPAGYLSAVYSSVSHPHHGALTVFSAALDFLSSKFCSYFRVTFTPF